MNEGYVCQLKTNRESQFGHHSQSPGGFYIGDLSANPSISDRKNKKKNEKQAAGPQHIEAIDQGEGGDTRAPKGRRG